MDLSIYLAFTGAELKAMQAYQGKTAWIGCHLSPYSLGIAPQPSALTHCDLLILTDETPPDGHDPKRVADEVIDAASRLGSERILLDFQRQPSAESHGITEELLKSTTIPVGVSSTHANDLSCPVFLSPPPLWTPLEEELIPWAGREIWLEIAPEDGYITLTEEGSCYHLCEPNFPYPFEDKKLHISYKTDIAHNEVTVYLRRDPSHMAAWLNDAGKLGVSAAIGLYQLLPDFHEINPCNP